MAHGDIAKFYDEIFGPDPLLLTDESQAKYSAGVLKHLLLSRTISTLRPDTVDLFCETSRQRFRRAPSIAAAAIDPELLDRYRESRRLRHELAPGDQIELQKSMMVSRGAYTGDRSGIEFPKHQKASEALRASKSPLEGRLRIASVGYRVQISRAEQGVNAIDDLCLLPKLRKSKRAGIPEKCAVGLGRTVGASPQAIEKWAEAVTEHIGSAQQRKCHIIVLPEFALPPLSTGSRLIEERIVNLAERLDVGDHLLFAGSCHHGAENSGLVIAKVEGAVSKPWWHCKIASARGLGENILGPEGKRRPSYAMPLQINENEGGLYPVSIGICYDTFDPTVFLELLLQSKIVSNDRQKLKFILVPSFNTSIDFVALLRDLSFLCRAVVIYVDGLHGDSRLFIHGFAVADFMDATKIAAVRSQIRDQIALLTKRTRPFDEYKRLNEEQARVQSAARRKKQALSVLENQLGQLQQDRALEAIMTLEGGVGAESENDRYHPSDALYYNLDMGLIGALAQFRDGYFEADEFLPLPLQYDELVAASEDLLARR